MYLCKCVNKLLPLFLNLISKYKRLCIVLSNDQEMHNGTTETVTMQKNITAVIKI